MKLPHVHIRHHMGPLTSPSINQDAFASHISITTPLVPFLVSTPTATTSFNQLYDPFVAVSNFPLSNVLPSDWVGPSVCT